MHNLIFPSPIWAKKCTLYVTKYNNSMRLTLPNIKTKNITRGPDQKADLQEVVQPKSEN